MALDRSRQVLLVLVAIMLAIVAYQLWPGATADPPSAASNVGGAPRLQGGKPAGPVKAPDVHLEALNEPRTKPDEVRRDLFRFKPKAPPPSPSSSQAVKPVPVPVPDGPPPPPPLPPIALKFIGIWELTEQKKKIAILSDGKGGVPIYGAEGETIEGRYRILRIGAESIELAYLDGRGRQTIRLSGQ
jgi:hypothetical protein